ncbi:MAG: isoprenylcysteine carboxylmethyltransferase family protein [Bacteroidales bacterium]|jgi:protein-S-isoprenylcysteine O-methyltransferase Ste14|nr:isoprenylcysteine carboxylmethyltransferase family protein [Bacteroidales bacterium]
MNYLALAIGTVLITAFSWYFSLREKRYHGIARFFSFESIFILVLLNWKVWFKDPFSGHQIISWILLFACIYPAIAGYLSLHKRGKPEDNHIERTTILVKSGIYKFIRHPLYCSLLVLGTGIMFKDPGKLQLILGAVNLLAIYFTARIEEKEMIKKFGPEYIQYMFETKMFIPFLF